jgi:hypothetical protein
MTGSIYVEVGDKDGVCFPANPQAWVEGLKQIFAGNEILRVTVCSTDVPGVVAVGFSPHEGLHHNDSDIQDQMELGEAFGFYCNAHQARELSKLFGLIAASEAD